MGIKEGTWCDEHWLLHTTDESLNSTLKLIIQYMLTKLNLNKKVLKKNRMPTYRLKKARRIRNWGGEVREYRKYVIDEFWVS